MALSGSVRSDDARDQVRARLNLVEVVQHHVRLRKQGREWVGLCPFHQEKTPSFSVNEQKQSWYCHGCGQGGDLFTFVELHEKTDFMGALRILAEMAGVELPERGGADARRTEQRRRILELMRLAVRYYEHVLFATAAGAPGRALLERRQVAEETARRFGLGYAPGGANFTAYLAKKGVDLADAQAAGLVRGGMDYFQGRVLVPIRDERGQPVAFTGRTVRDDEPRKYVNTPETPAYVKGRVLFGLDLARGGIDERGHAVLMEGQFDVIVAHQFGVTNAVASSGTALTEDQVRLLRRYTDELVLLFDNDRAGKAAAVRAVELAQAQGMRTRVARLDGEAKDPDEFFRGGGSWRPVLEAARPGWEFCHEVEFESLNLGRPSDLEVALRRAAAIREKIAEPALREEWRRWAARRLGVEEHLLVDVPRPDVPGAAKRGVAPTVERRERPASGFSRPQAGKKAVSSFDYLIHVLAVRGDAVWRVEAALEPDDLEEEDRAAYFRIVETLKRGGVDALVRELPGYPPEEESRVRRAWAKPPPRTDDEVVDELVRRIKERAVKRRMLRIVRDLQEAERRGDRAAAAALERQHRALAGRP
jgi:DNA primase